VEVSDDSLLCAAADADELLPVWGKGAGVLAREGGFFPLALRAAIVAVSVATRPEIQRRRR
jgi:hypothetical protein